jgi:hypothetical protein
MKGLTVRRALFGLMAVAIFTGCGSHSGGSTQVTPDRLSGSKSVKIALFIPSVVTQSTSNVRAVRNVSSATDSVVVIVKDTASGNTLGTSTTDVAAGSPACTSQGGGRTCTVYVAVEPTTAGVTDTFTFQTFDQEPDTNGNVPAGANLLSIGSIVQAVVSGAANQLNVALAGVASSIVLTPTNFVWSGSDANTVGVIADGAAHQYTFAASLLDADGRTIVLSGGDPSNPGSTGTNNPYQPTVTYTSESNFSSAPPQHTTFASAPQDLTQAVTIAYDGGGSASGGPGGAPYSGVERMTLTYPASTPGLAVGQSSTVSTSVTVVPFYLSFAVDGAGNPVSTTSVGADGYATGIAPSVSFTIPGQTAALIPSEAGGSFAVSSSGTSCSGVAALGSPSIGSTIANGATISFATQPVGTFESGVTSPIPGVPCTVALTDAYGTTITTTVNYALTGVGITIPSAIRRVRQ